jgi:hypothetical protein
MFKFNTSQSYIGDNQSFTDYTKRPIEEDEYTDVSDSEHSVASITKVKNTTSHESPYENIEHNTDHTALQPPEDFAITFYNAGWVFGIVLIILAFTFLYWEHNLQCNVSVNEETLLSMDYANEQINKQWDLSTHIET